MTIISTNTDPSADLINEVARKIQVKTNLIIVYVRNEEYLSDQLLINQFTSCISASCR